VSDTIITVENLGKKYSLQHQRGERYTALRDVLTERAKSLFRRNSDKSRAGGQNGSGRATREDFWALKDVSFEVKQGEVVGIIGRNGAGKSTLLKILSRITDPSEGRVRLKGRVASLLEVGTGFHPELTGRENIFLNGAILGMGREEIRRKFDEIVAFADVEKFLDTPVKRYSSGMYVRLAFAVAAHLEPEILVIDEVLAVGDAEFQKKCLGKMQDVARKQHRTVLFVSHNMAAVRSITSRSIVQDKGHLQFDGPTGDAINFYTQSLRSSSDLQSRQLGSGVHTTIRNVKLLNSNHQSVDSYDPGAPLLVEITFETDGTPGLSIELFLLDSNQAKLGLASTHHFHGLDLPTQAGRYTCVFNLEPLWLASGSYGFDVCTAVVNQCWDHYVDDAIEFSIVASNPGGLPWDFKHSYGYGAMALVCRDAPAFARVPEDSPAAPVCVT
jgi:lipopolysaccharide transport system ATP-binding protein